MTQHAPRQTSPPDAGHFLDAGAGPQAVCLHANASTSGQWRPLCDLLAPKFRVLAPDLHDAGKGPPWRSATPLRLADEAALIDALPIAGDAPLALVGHSYGAAVALIGALKNPRRIHAMALYEPTLFALLDAERPPPNDADGIRATVADATAALDAGNPDGAAQRFIDYWMGAGTWDAMPASRRVPIAASVRNVRRWAHALLHEPATLEAFRSLDLPVLYMTGKRSPASARGVARLLTTVLPDVRVVEFDGLGHMGPVTHPGIVNRTIAEFLDEHYRI